MKVYIITMLKDGVNDVIIKGVYVKLNKALNEINKIAMQDSMKDITKSSYQDHIKEYANAWDMMSLDEYEVIQ